MTPRPLDWRSVRAKLRKIEQLLDALEAMAPVTADAPDTYAESFDAIADAGVVDRDLAAALVPSAKMRNVLVHAYLDVDHEIVAAAVPLALAQYRSYTRQVARWFQDLPGVVTGRFSQR